MPAHIKSALTNNQISLSVKDKQVNTWDLAGFIFV